jgi:ADP-ribosylglycohydrolase
MLCLAHKISDRLARGAISGQAIGNTVEFSPRGSFKPLTDMVGGGPLGLLPGQSTDDTTTALCQVAAGHYERKSETTTARSGQLAGEYDGESGIPSAWLQKFATANQIWHFAEQLAHSKNGGTLP